MTCIRHPIERAFSHYWHEKKKLRFNFKFEEALENFDLYTNWIEPGFYTLHLKRFFKYFSKNHILIQFFDKLQDDPKIYLQELLHFIGINTNFQPSVLYEKVNAAVPRIPTPFEQNKQKVLKQLKTIGLYKPIKLFKKNMFRHLNILALPHLIHFYNELKSKNLLVFDIVLPLPKD